MLTLLLACTPDDPNPRIDPTTPVSTTPVDLPRPLQRAIADAVEADLQATNATGASVAIWRDGALVYAAGFGTVSPGGSPVTPDTLFQIGSDTKKITAIAALHAVEQGSLSLDDTVADTIPEFSLQKSPDWADQATLHHLLSHQGGTYDWTPWGDDPADDALEATGLGAFAEQAYEMAPPGRIYNYSNPNFSLAGWMVERATGRAWADVVREDVFEPLGLTSTYARLADVPTERAASGVGYTSFEADDLTVWWDSDYAWGTLAPEDQADNAFIRPAGLVWSTASDMARLGAFLMDGDPAVLEADHLEALHTVHAVQYPGNDVFGGYAYGLVVAPQFYLGSDVYDVPIWAHGGNTLTMTSAFFVLPEQGVVVSILSNGYGDSFPNTIVTALGEVPRGLPTPHPPTVPALATANDLVGSWVDPYGVGTMAITLDTYGVLHLDAPGLDAVGIAYDDIVQPDIAGVGLAEIGGGVMELSVLDGGSLLRNRLFVGRDDAAAPALHPPAVRPSLPVLAGPRPSAAMFPAR